MELTEFARKILESASLEEKLAPPAGELSDHAPGSPASTPTLPGRPADLRLRTNRDRTPFPAAHQLEGDAEQRGILLHFFANHELLATELMALVLLKFPDAPAEFRRGVLATLQEEQRHTRMYLARMEECGIRFGDLPVSDYFWKSVAPMETPFDYVTRLSLTFEQANLDYSRHYAEIFRTVGDVKTSAILDRIFRDEIAHVGYGLEWFRRWKNKEQSDWEAYEHALPFPLSPSRAKANGAPAFNAAARRKAGLDEDFVRHLELFERSKGRTPHVYCFTPDEEAAMAESLDGKKYHPRAALKDLARDLEILPAFLARRDDLVLVSEIPSPGHLRHLRENGFTLPEFEALAAQPPGGQSLAPDSLSRDRKLGELRPWAWGPRSARLLAPLLPNLPGDDHSIATYWNENRRSLYSKTSDLALLEKLSNVDPAIRGTLCTTSDQFDSALEQIAANGFERAALKAPFGSSGQRNQFIDLPLPADDPARRWSKSIMDRQGGLIVEPALERVLDFSIQYELTPETLRHLAVVRLENDRRGQFLAAVTGPKPAQGLPPELAQFFTETLLHYNPGEPLPNLLESHLRSKGHHGPLGIDAFIYREPATQELRLKPIVEINPRYTMGRIAHELRRFVTPGRCLRFELAPLSSASLPSDPPALDAKGKLTQGTLPLNDPARTRHLQALLHVAPRMKDL